MANSKWITPKILAITGLTCSLVLLIAIVRLEAAPRSSSAAAQADASRVAVSPDSIGGAVTNSNGPEASGIGATL